MTFLAAVDPRVGRLRAGQDRGADERSYNGPLADVKQALKNGADVNVLDEDGENALMYAVSGGHDTSPPTSWRTVPTSTGAARARHGAFLRRAQGAPSAARLLLEKGADVNARTSTGATPLVIAASHGSVKTAAALVASGADLTPAARTGRRPSCRDPGGTRRRGRLLIEKGADVTRANNNGSTPLIAAAFKGAPGSPSCSSTRRDVKAADATASRPPNTPRRRATTTSPR